MSKLATIAAADAVGCSLLVGGYEVGTLTSLRAYRDQLVGHLVVIHGR